MWFESSWGWLRLKGKYSHSFLMLRKFCSQCLLRRRRVRMRWETPGTFPVQSGSMKAHHTHEHSSPRKCGQSHGSPELKWPHPASLPHGKNDQAWEGKSTPKQVLYWREGSPDISSLYFSSWGSSWRGGELNFQKQPSEQVSSSREMEKSWDHPTTQNPRRPNKYPSKFCMWLFPSTPSAYRTAACGLHSPGWHQRAKC